MIGNYQLNLFTEQELIDMIDHTKVFTNQKSKDSWRTNNLILNSIRTGKYQFPILCPCYTEAIPNSAYTFSKAYTQQPQKGGMLHFFEDDAKFERLWNAPNRYLGFLRRFKYVVEPDFSLLINMPLAVQIYNLYKNLLLAFWLQCNGINVVPQACWSDGRSYDWCFSGLPNSGTIVISTTGALKNGISKKFFWHGLHAFFEHIIPDKIWLCGYHENKKIIDFIAQRCPVEFINTNHHGK